MKKYLLLILAVISICLYSCSSGAPQSTAQPPENNPAQQEEPENPNTDPSNENIDTEKDKTSEENNAEKKDERGIIGSHTTDIHLGMEQFGLEDHSVSAAPDDAKDIYAHASSCSCENTDLDASLDYSLTADSERQLISGSFGISWLANGNNDDFVSAAKTYLGFAATIPYDTSDSDTVKAWVSDNIPSVADGDSVTTTVGDATFELSGTVGNGNYTSFELYIRKAGSEGTPSSDEEVEYWEYKKD